MMVITQYSALLCMIAHVTGYKPGKLIHVIADAHIYDKHIPIVKELIKRETYPAPKVELNPDVKNFYDFKRTILSSKVKRSCLSQKITLFVWIDFIFN